MKSTKPYWVDPLSESFEVRIIEVERNEDQYYIQMDKDVIRPEGGGQAGERGEIEGIPILNTIILDDKVLIVTTKPLEVGSKAMVHIDMDWRRATMRNHTAEHILVNQLISLDNSLKLGYIWINGEQGIVDIEGDVQLEDVFKAERNVQEIIYSDISVQTKFLDANELPETVRAREGLTDKYELLRIVSIEGIDESACSGIHVQSTGDIGFFKITDFKPTDTGFRFQFKTHRDASLVTQTLFNEILQRKTSFPYELEQIGSVIDKARKIQDDKEGMMKLIIELISQIDDHTGIGDYKFSHFYLPGFDAKTLRSAIKSMPSESQSCKLLFAPGRKSSFIFWTNAMPRDAAKYMKDITEELGGKCGGSKESFTGGFQDVEDPFLLYNRLIDGVIENLRKDV